MLTEEDSRRIGENLMRKEYGKTGKVRIHFRLNVAIVTCQGKTLGIDRETGDITDFDAADTTREGEMK